MKYSFFDDKQYIDKIKNANKEIEKLKGEINKCKLKLEDNNKINGILYKTGNELNKEIVSILEDILKEHNNFEDKLEKNGNEETKCLFFVASDRKKNISERKKINPRQETTVKRNNTLIIDTPSFLDIYEDFLNNKISKEEIIKILKRTIGGY